MKRNDTPKSLMQQGKLKTYQVAMSRVLNTADEILAKAEPREKTSNTKH